MWLIFPSLGPSWVYTRAGSGVAERSCLDPDSGLSSGPHFHLQGLGVVTEPLCHDFSTVSRG